MEILAPAGSIVALRYAINAGADAVYFGLSEHNARIKSQDFNIDNLSEWVDYCHLYGVKAYITLNTSVKDSEIPRIVELIRAIDNCNVDAVIATDIAVIKLVKELAPRLPIHISTQAGVHNLSGAKFYERLGAKRVVLARECAEQDVTDIIDNTSLEVERFAHGALCVAFSGGCLLSSVIGGMSGNRGRCLQPCRKEHGAYDAKGNFVEKGYLLSTFDLAVCEKALQYKSQGVTCIKIEGRLKRPEYVGIVTDYYRRLLDGGKPSDTELKKVFMRGAALDNYGASCGMIYKNTPNHIGISIGKIISIERRKGFLFAEITSSHALRAGDGLKLLRDGKEVGGASVTSVKRRGKHYIVPVSGNATVGDEVRLTTDSAQLEAAAKHRKRIGISIEFVISAGDYPQITARKHNAVAEYTAMIQATSGALTDTEISEQLSKIADTPFEIKTLDIDNSGGKVAKSVLNGMRREVLSRLKKAIIAEYQKDMICQRACIAPHVAARPATPHAKRGARLIEVQSVKQLIGLSADAVIINPVRFDKNTLLDIARQAKSVTDELFIKMPRVNRRGAFDEIFDLARINGLGVLADNVYAVELAREKTIPYIAGMGLNIYNSVAFDYYFDAEYIMPSPEIGLNNLLEKGGVLFTLGRLPLMTLTHCPFSVLYRSECVCKKRGEMLYYKSGRYTFPILPTSGKDCQFTLYNGVPHNLLSRIAGMGYNNYINLATYTSLEQLAAKKGTAGHFNNEVI